MSVRPSLRRVAIVAMVLLLPVVAHAVWDYVELRRLVREINEIRAEGEPVTQLQAAGGYRKTSLEQELAGRRFIAAGVLGYPAASLNRDALPPIREFVAGAQRKPFDQDAIATRLESAIQDGADALSQVDAAVGLPFFGLPPGSEYSYRTSELLALMELQSIRTARQSLSADGDAAFASILTWLKSRRALSQPIAWWWLRSAGPEVAMALSFTQPSKARIQAVLTEIQEQDRDDAVERDALTERAFFVERVFRDVYGGDPEAPHAYRLPYKGFRHLLWRPLFTHNFVKALQGWKALVKASRQPWPAKAIQMRAISEARFEKGFGQHDSPPRGYWLFPREFQYVLLAPNPPRVSYIATERATQIALAVALYRNEHGGRLPATLNDLKPKYLSELPLDPASGAAFKYRSDPGAFIVYSVGADGVDDGGDLTSGLKRTTPRLEGADVGIRVLTRGVTMEVTR